MLDLQIEIDVAIGLTPCRIELAKTKAEQIEEHEPTLLTINRSSPRCKVVNNYSIVLLPQLQKIYSL